MRAAVVAIEESELSHSSDGGSDGCLFVGLAQWIVSLLGVLACFGTIAYLAFKEDWKLGVVSLFPPFLLFYYIPTRWPKHARLFSVLFMVLFICGVLAALLQRARLGYWAWPDVGR